MTTGTKKRPKAKTRRRFEIDPESVAFTEVWFAVKKLEPSEILRIFNHVWQHKHYKLVMLKSSDL